MPYFYFLLSTVPITHTLSLITIAAKQCVLYLLYFLFTFNYLPHTLQLTIIKQTRYTFFLSTVCKLFELPGLFARNLFCLPPKSTQHCLLSLSHFLFVEKTVFSANSLAHFVFYFLLFASRRQNRKRKDPLDYFTFT